MLNRTNTPILKSIETIDFVKPKIYDISKSARLFFMKEVPNDTSRIDLYFDAGTMKGNLGIAAFVNGLLLSGTKEKSSIIIHNELDALGAFHESTISHENAIISIYALKENLIPILRLYKNAIENVIFDPQEVEELVSDRKQKFRVNMEKVSFLAQRVFQNQLFDGSPYGRVLNAEDYDNLSIAEMKLFHKEHYMNGLTKVVVVGDLSQDEIDEIIDLTGTWATESVSEFEKELVNRKEKTHVEKLGALQSAIRLGKILFNKSHEDFIDFQVLNTILGDYFGSRLMSNIREDKGYTYGIGSMLAELHETGYFLIATEVGKDVKDATLKEIQFEIERLKTDLVPQEELDLVKNYLLGQLLKSADGPYSMIDLYMGLEPYGLDMEFYNESIRKIQRITPERIRELAQKHLNWEDFTIVSAG
jgi:predicted Zn-dependent peptidase